MANKGELRETWGRIVAAGDDVSTASQDERAGGARRAFPVRGVAEPVREPGRGAV
jgi:hypothetical protein